MIWVAFFPISSADKNQEEKATFLNVISFAPRFSQLESPGLARIAHQASSLF